MLRWLMRTRTLRAVPAHDQTVPRLQGRQQAQRIVHPIQARELLHHGLAPAAQYHMRRANILCTACKHIGTTAGFESTRGSRYTGCTHFSDRL